VKEKLTVIGALLLLAILLNAGQLVAAGTPIVGGGTNIGSSPYVAATDEARSVDGAVTVSFSPNPISGPPAKYTVTMSIQNKGTTTFEVTGCTLKITYSTHKTVKAPCTFGETFPVFSSATESLSWTWTVGSGTPLGTSTWVLTVLGTVNHQKVQSKPGTQTINVT